jgi:hypothetical protein
MDGPSGPTHQGKANALKKQQEEKRRKRVAKEFRQNMIATTCVRLIECRQKNGRTLIPHGKVAEAVQDLKDNGVHVTRSMLNYMLRKTSATGVEEVRAPLTDIAINLEQDSNVSSLHGVEGVENTPIPVTIPVTVTNKPGCPKGSTKANSVEEDSQKELCITAISKVFDTKMVEMRAAGQRIPKGYLMTLIREMKKDHNISDNFYISNDTIRTRVKRKRLDPPIPGSCLQSQRPKSHLCKSAWPWATYVSR